MCKWEIEDEGGRERESKGWGERIDCVFVCVSENMEEKKKDKRHVLQKAMKICFPKHNLSVNDNALYKLG